MYRLLLYLLAGLLVSCTQEPLFSTLPATARAALQPADSSAPPSVVLVLPENNKRGQVVVQLGQGHQAAATGTDNTGRAAGDGANGGHAEQHDHGTPAWVFVLLVAIGVVGGALAYAKWGPPPRPLLL